MTAILTRFEQAYRALYRAKQDGRNRIGQTIKKGVYK